MDAQTKREDAEFAARLARILNRAHYPNMAGEVEKVASALRNATEEPQPPWTPKFKPGDMVRRIKDKSKGGVVSGTCYDNRCGNRGRVGMGQPPPMLWEDCPHESELELGEPIPATPPIPLGPEDVVLVGEHTRDYIMSLRDPGEAWVHHWGWEPLSRLTRVGPPAEITPGRAVHVLDKNEKVLHEGLCIGRGQDAVGPFWSIEYVLGWPNNPRLTTTSFYRNNLRLAACLKGA